MKANSKQMNKIIISKAEAFNSLYEAMEDLLDKSKINKLELKEILELYKNLYETDQDLY